MTLVELLLAMTIATLILTGISSTFYSIVTAQKTVTVAADDDRLARLLTARLAREIAASPRTPDSSPIVGRDDGDRDEIAIASGGDAAMREMKYHWRDEVFLRSETDPFLVTQAGPVEIRGVTKFGLRYFDGKEWSPEWNGPGQPSAVALELSIHDRKYGTIFTP